MNLKNTHIFIPKMRTSPFIYIYKVVSPSEKNFWIRHCYTQIEDNIYKYLHYALKKK